MPVSPVGEEVDAKESWCTAGAGTWRSHKHCRNLMLEKLLEMQALDAEETVYACRNLPGEHTDARGRKRLFSCSVSPVPLIDKA